MLQKQSIDHPFVPRSLPTEPIAYWLQHRWCEFRFGSVRRDATRVVLVRCVAVNNGNGLVAAGTPAVLTSAQSTVTGNTTGWLASGSGAVLSYGDNNVDGNTGGESVKPLLATK
jgi:hypothetical protein